jgi:hypothetical protein
MTARRMATRFVVMAALSATPGDLRAQDSIRVADSLVVNVSGRRFGTGGARQLVFGRHYRGLWNSQIKAEVLDLGRVAGGLTPYREGGGAQTLSLRFRGADSLTYVFRGLDKDPTRRWPDELRGTFAARLAEDQMSALHPGASLVVAELLTAAGILHITPRLVWMPDDPRLGAYRERYGRMLGLFEERPAKGDTRVPGLADARRIADTDELFGELDKGPRNRVDARQFLAARLMDLYVGDWDRHPDQWVWARFDEGEIRRWEPLPRDRDWALTRLDGLAVAIGRMIQPKHVSFGPEYGSVLGLTLSGQALDRRLLSELTRPVFDSIAATLELRLTDAVIDSAVSRLPPELYSMNGDELRTALRARRGDLRRAAAEFYEILAGEVNVFGTDEPERARIERTARGVDLALYAGDAADAYFHRRFDADETGELRVYLQGGADVVEIGGGGASRPMVRVVTGQGRDRIVDSSSTGDIRLYDVGAGTRLTSVRGVEVRRKPYVEYAVTDSTLIPPRDWGEWRRYGPWIASSPDVGFFLGASATRYGYGFRKQPYASRVTVRGGYAMGASTFRAELDGEFRRTNARTYTSLLLRASGIEIVRFHGFGNETVIAGTDAFYRVAQEQYLVAPSVSLPLAGPAMLTLTPTLKYAATDVDPLRAIAIFQPYGTDGFGQVGAQADVTLDTRDWPAAATRGVRAIVGGSVYPAVWDVEETFGEVHGELGTYLSAQSAPLRPTLAVRGAARKVFGAYPFFEAAFVGGAGTVRGLREQRYAGDAAVYGNAELRLALGRVSLLLPTDVGVFGLVDGGRVFLEGESSSKVHTGVGGGLSMGFLSPANTVTFALVRGEDRTSFYLRAGFGY